MVYLQIFFFHAYAYPLDSLDVVIQLGHSEWITSVTVSADERFVASASLDGTIKLWDIASGRLLRTLIGHSDVVESISTSPYGTFLVSGSADTTVRLWDVASGRCMKTFFGHSGNVYSVNFLSDGETVVSGSADTTIQFRNVKTFKLIKILYTYNPVFSLTVTGDKKFLISGGKDCKVHLWDLVKYNEVAQCIVSASNEWAVVTPDNYYFTNKGTLENIHFVKGLDIYTFSQLDLKYNRPDIVLERLGKASNNLIVAYRKAYEKRLQKMGFDPAQFEKDFTLNTPEITIDYPSSRFIDTFEPYCFVRFRAEDKLCLIERVFVTVNGVPLYGVKGKFLEQKNNIIFQSLKIPLSRGNNIIAISVLNEKGVESLPKRIDVLYSPVEPSKPNLYIVAIGASRFNQSEYNLTYADKDAKDFIKLFERKRDSYNEIKVFLFLIEDVKREKILQLKRILHNTTPDDYVIIFMASHGLLDDNLNYYIATYDTDFANPQERGLKYEDVENLLDGIPARQKIMLIDACHSGELDKDEMPLGGVNVKMDSNVKSRGFGVAKSKEYIVGLQNSFELMKELFADLRRHNGTIVIASAGSEEYAYESAKWKNGVFTYCIIEGLSMKKADSNKDGGITVYELMEYVAQRTRELTAGRQNPASRKENVIANCKVW